MIRRLAAVAWWIGTLFGIAGIGMGAAVVITCGETCHGGKEFGGWFFSGLGIVALVLLWALSFVLAGSFLRPPR